MVLISVLATLPEGRSDQLLTLGISLIGVSGLGYAISRGVAKHGNGKT